MSEPKPEPIQDRVKSGREPLTAAEVHELEQATAMYRQGNEELVRSLMQRGFQVDAGMEAIVHMRWFLREIGVINNDQAAALAASWEATFHAQLRTLAKQVTEATRPAIVTPPNHGRGLIVPK